MEITRLQPAGLVLSPAFSHVAVVPPGAATIYVGGQNGVDATGAVVSDDVAEQSVRAIDNASTALEAAGASLADVVDIVAFLVDMADFGGYNEVYAEYFGAGAGPARTTVAVHQLPHPHMRIEVKAVAWKPLAAGA